MHQNLKISIDHIMHEDGEISCMRISCTTRVSIISFSPVILAQCFFQALVEAAMRRGASLIEEEMVDGVLHVTKPMRFKVNVACFNRFKISYHWMHLQTND